MSFRTREIGLAFLALNLLSLILPEAHAPPPAPSQTTRVVHPPASRRPCLSLFKGASEPASKASFRPVEANQPARLILTEELILGLAEGRSLVELRVLILALYPELVAALDETLGPPRKNAIRRSADLYRMRQELIAVVLAEYAAATRDLP